MATTAQMADTYDYMDRYFRLSMGETADITCAFYDGEYTKPLERAQRDKHDYIFRNLSLGRGSRVLDIGCGWGPMLKAIEERGGHGVGLTLSPKHFESCRRNGFEVYLQDWKESSVSALGSFDGVVSLGAFEHFCSVEEYHAGQQSRIYREFFKLCGELLPSKGRLFLQTVIWGRAAPPCWSCTVHARKGSNEYLVGVLKKFYPGSWLPESLQQIEEAAWPHFTIVSHNNGRLDYIETLMQWHRRVSRPSAAKLVEALRVVPRYLSSRDFRYKMKSLLSSGGYMRECLVREVMDHQRITLEKCA